MIPNASIFWWNWWIRHGASCEMLRKMIQSEFQNSIKTDIVTHKYKLTCGGSLEIGWVVVEKRASEVSPFFDCDALCCDPLELQQKGSTFFPSGDWRNLHRRVREHLFPFEQFPSEKLSTVNGYLNYQSTYEIYDGQTRESLVGWLSFFSKPFTNRQ